MVVMTTGPVVPYPSGTIPFMTSGVPKDHAETRSGIDCMRDRTIQEVANVDILDGTLDDIGADPATTVSYGLGMTTA